MRVDAFEARFVEFIPATIEQGVLYISREYETSTHLCACGCGNKVVLPLKPTYWRLVSEVPVTLYPSVGNWSFPCQSHYWIRKNRVKWSYKMTGAEIEAGRRRDRAQKARQFDQPLASAATPEVEATLQARGIWSRIKSWFGR